MGKFKRILTAFIVPSLFEMCGFVAGCCAMEYGNMFVRIIGVIAACSAVFKLYKIYDAWDIE